MQHLQPNSTLQSGKYRILNVLGQGGFGITYLAENTMLDGKVAIKEFFFKEYCNRDEETSHVTIPTDGNRDIVERFKAKFIKEARTIFKLNHPNIVRILDVFEENGTAYYVMDYIEGESLGDMVKRRGAIPQAEAIGYIRETGSALTYIHSQSMNHLDIKPGNLMKRRDNNKIQVIDFGVAKQYDMVTSEGTTTTPVGISHGYSPSEQYQKNGVQSFSPQSDVYALAATLFKLLTGNTPPEAMIVQDEGLPIDELREKGVTEPVIRAIDAAMQTRRKRTQSVAEFLRNLDADDEEGTILTEEAQKAEAERQQKREAETNRQAAEKAAAERRAAEAAERRRKQEKGSDEEKRKKITRRVIYGIAALAVIILASVGINALSGRSESEPLDGEQLDLTALTNRAEIRTQVTDRTIVLTHGHESKRNYVYSGEVDANGVPNGEGTAQYPETKSSSSSTFTGTFANGIPSNGTMTFSTGVKYKGEFNTEGYYTQGTLWDKDGYYFEGTFQEGQPYNGTWFDASGNEYSKVVNGN